MQSQADKTAADLARLREGQARGPLGTLRAYLSLSGPGWLQSAVTLGGGSLAGSLYLGIVAGYSMLWVQPLAMVLGIVMLSAIGYVTLSTGERPFKAINQRLNPVLGWGWALATLAANMVWSLPQFSLGTGVLQQNLLPGLVGVDGALGREGGKLACVVFILGVSVYVTWAYGKGGKGVRVYERVLKILVGLIVLCFMGVVLRLATSGEGFDWGAIAAGFIPDFASITNPSATYEPHLAAITDGAREYWSTHLVSMQRDVMIAAAATAVGINMTFLLPSSLLARGWTKEFRGLAIFDMGTGMLIPFLLATTCVVIASASRFHVVAVPGLATPLEEGQEAPGSKLVGQFEKLLTQRAATIAGAETWAEFDDTARQERTAALPQAERTLAAMLVKRDVQDLARSLRPLTGDFFADLLFGIGVLAMALSTISILMLISGFVICEMLGIEPKGRAHQIACLAAATGVFGPYIWGEAAAYLAIPTSVFGMILLPIAYWTFALMMNSDRILGEHRPRGRARWAWNSLMLPAAGVATAASLWSVWAKSGTTGIGCVGAFLVLVFLARKKD